MPNWLRSRSVEKPDAKELRREQKAAVVKAPKPAAKEKTPSTFGEDQRRALALMREDNLEAAAPYRATDYWIELNERFDTWFSEQGLLSLEKQPYNALFSTPARGSGKYYSYAVTLLYREVLEQDAHGVLDRVHAHGSPKSVLAFGEHRVSWELLLSIRTLYSIGEVQPAVFSEPVVVADLGAGWGRIGHVLKSVNPRATYLAFDLPEALTVASSFLPPLLPDARIVGYEDSRGLELTRDLLSEPAVRFLGTQQLEDVEDGAIDVLVNVASFQEMTTAQVTAYLGIIDRVARGTVLEERRKSPGGLTDRVIPGYEAYAFPARWERRFLRETSHSSEFFEVGFSVPRGSGA